MSEIFSKGFERVYDMVDMWYSYTCIFYKYLWLKYIDWLDVVSIFKIGKYNFLRYQLDGKHYMIPIGRRKTQLTNTKDVGLDLYNHLEKTHGYNFISELQGPKGNWHGQIDVLRSVFME